MKVAVGRGDPSAISVQRSLGSRNRQKVFVVFGANHKLEAEFGQLLNGLRIGTSPTNLRPSKSEFAEHDDDAGLDGGHALQWCLFFRDTSRDDTFRPPSSRPPATAPRSLTKPNFASSAIASGSARDAARVVRNSSHSNSSPPRQLSHTAELKCRETVGDHPMEVLT